MSHEAMTANALCTNCGADGAQVFCAKCGEKQPHHHDLTMGHFAHEVFHELVHLDSKLFRTLRDLVTKPGELTASYFAGRKMRYIAPLRLFLTFFALQFLAYTMYKPVAIYTLDGIFQFGGDNKLEAKMKQAAAKRKMSYEQARDNIEHRLQKNMSLLNVAHIAGLAVVLKLLYARRRKFLAEHMVFAAHYLSFGYLMSLAIWPIYLLIGLRRSTAHFVLTVVIFVVMYTYLYLAMRRYYAQEKRKTLVKAVLALGGSWVVNVLLMTAALIGAIVQVF